MKDWENVVPEIQAPFTSSCETNIHMLLEFVQFIAGFHEARFNQMLKT